MLLAIGDRDSAAHATLCYATAKMSEADGTCEAMQRSERPEDEAQPEQGKPEVQLTDTLRLGTQDLHSRAESIASKVSSASSAIFVSVARAPPLALQLVSHR